MNNLLFKKSVTSIFVVILFLAMNTASADEEIPFTDELLQELFAGKQWECKWIDGPSKKEGTKVYTYDENISEKKITGKATNTFCPGVIGELTGKIKKGKGVGKLKHGSPCINTSGKYTLYKKADGSYYQKGPYTYTWTDGKRYGGNAVCHPM